MGGENRGGLSRKLQNRFNFRLTLKRVGKKGEIRRKTQNVLFPDIAGESRIGDQTISYT